MVKEYSSDEVVGTLKTELVTEEYPDIEGQLLAVSRSNLNNRRVDYFIRIFNGQLQERQDFYDSGELFHSEDWREFGELYLSGGKVKFPGGGPTEDGEDPVEWAERYSEDWLTEYTTEIWSDKMNSHNENTS